MKVAVPAPAASDVKYALALPVLEVVVPRSLPWLPGAPRCAVVTVTRVGVVVVVVVGLGCGATSQLAMFVVDSKS